MTTHYVPGVCNINDAEVSFRKQAGYFFGVMTIVLICMLIGFKAHPLFGALVLLPLTTTIVQFLQVRNRFCAGFGLRGVYSVDEIYKHIQSVENADNRTIDRKKSVRIYVQGFILSLMMSVITMLILGLV